MADTLLPPGSPVSEFDEGDTSVVGLTAPRPVGIDEALAALRSLPHGGFDDGARHLVLTPEVRATVSPLIGVARWSAVVSGMVFGSKAALAGDLQIVLTLSACLFITTWRTILPLPLGSPARATRIAAISDVVLLSAAIGYTGGPQSPFIACALVAVGVAAFGWGARHGVVALATCWFGMLVGATVGQTAMRIGSQTFATVVVAGIGLVALTLFLRVRLIDAEQQRQRVAGRLSSLGETNDLLMMLNSVARTLPASLSLREALESARHQLVMTFRPQVICLMELDEAHDEWVPKLAEGAMLRPSSTLAELPAPLRMASASTSPLLVPRLAEVDYDGIAAGSGSGMYVRLVARHRTVGLLGIEHQLPDKFTGRDRALLSGLADVLALSIDNARWFGRLRSLGAEEERVRIARDLHDRLGQWLTHISFELERIITTHDVHAPELTRLYTDVQTALDELRETLRQLRSGIGEGRPLSKVGAEIVERFIERTDLDVSFDVTNPDHNLPIPVENELLRILQECLSNIDRHARAHSVRVSWECNSTSGTLTIVDDGVGFDQRQGVRDNAYGLVGMRERADVIGGRLNVSSAPGGGTTISVSVVSTTTRVTTAQKEN